jgi:hypothetical protein
MGDDEDEPDAQHNHLLRESPRALEPCRPARAVILTSNDPTTAANASTNFALALLAKRNKPA